MVDFATQHKAIRERFDDQWADTLASVHNNVDFTPDKTATQNGYVRVTIADAAAIWASMGAPGSNVQRNAGLVTLSVFTPSGNGDALALAYADQLAAIFRSWSHSASGVRFRVPPYVRQIGKNGKWYQLNVLAPFERDSLL